MKSSKDKAYFHQKQKPAKYRWTQAYRKLHKKGTAESRLKKRKKATKKPQRAVVGMDMEHLKRVRRETEAQRKERNDSNLKELRERRAKAKAAAGKAKAAQPSKTAQPKARGTGAKGR